MTVIKRGASSCRSKFQTMFLRLILVCLASVYASRQNEDDDAIIVTFKVDHEKTLPVQVISPK